MTVKNHDATTITGIKKKLEYNRKSYKRFYKRSEKTENKKE